MFLLTALSRIGNIMSMLGNLKTPMRVLIIAVVFLVISSIFEIWDRTKLGASIGIGLTGLLVVFALEKMIFQNSFIDWLDRMQVPLVSNV